ncbi:MAG: Spy/CpxP family protein refolding chaperone [Candidatus Zixiibacteriota bacterium]|nr:MAG: Spy/CpxP family protein refolding chaperone [candidate division Zixibacteria bacterium]
MKKLIAIGLTAVILAPAIVVGQQGSGRGFCDGTGRPMGRQMGACLNQNWQPGVQRILALGDQIGLTDAQREQLQSMRTGFQLARIDAEAELKKAHLAMKMSMTDLEASETDVFRAIDEVSRLRAEMQKLQYQHRKQMQSVLTDEQMARLKELRAERQTLRKERMMKHPRMGRGGGRHGR